MDESKIEALSERLLARTNEAGAGVTDRLAFHIGTADEAVGDTLQEKRNELGHLMYNFSVLHCLPQAMVYPDAAGTGTVLRPSLLRRYAEEAGFATVEVLPIENPFWRFYRLGT